MNRCNTSTRWLIFLTYHACLSKTTIAYNAQPVSPVHTLLLLRHGDSIWNGGLPSTHERFTGWTDVDLSDRGKREAEIASNQVSTYLSNGNDIDLCFMSTLKRAHDTAKECLGDIKHFKCSNNDGPKILSDYRLNERHYGALQGLIKKDVEAGKYGHDKEDVEAWRRKWFAVPPLLEDNDPRRIEEVSKYSSICGGEHNVPRGESLEIVAKTRVRPFINEVLAPTLNRSYESKLKSSQEDIEGSTGLVVAHANSLRALIGILCEVEDDNEALKVLEALKLPTGIPLVMKYQQLSDGTYQVCDLPEAEECLLVDDDYDISIPADEAPPDLGHSKLPVWPLNSCIPVYNIIYGNLRAVERETGKIYSNF